VDEDTANIVEGVADAAENQASADRDASIADRLKMAGGDAAGMVADNVDNEYVSVSFLSFSFMDYYRVNFDPTDSCQYSSGAARGRR